MIRYLHFGQVTAGNNFIDKLKMTDKPILEVKITDQGILSGYSDKNNLFELITVGNNLTDKLKMTMIL